MSLNRASVCQATLRSVSFLVEWEGVAASVQANFSYKNELKHPLESPILTLPLPKAATLQGFEVQDLHGEVRSGQAAPCPTEASSFYELAQVSHKVQLKRLAEGEELLLQLKFLLVLQAKQKSGRHAFELALTLPAAAKNGKAAAQAVSLRLVGSPLAHADVTSSTPGAVLQREEGALLVTSAVLQDVSLDMAMTRDEDFFLSLQRHPETGRLAAAIWRPPGTAQLAGESPLEIFLIIDASSSMHSERLQRVQQALRLLLRTVPENCRINLLGHDPTAPAAALHSQSPRLTEEVFLQMDAALSAERSGAPGARIAGAAELLAAALGARAENSQLRVLLVTDRHPPDQKAAVELVEDQCGTPDCQVFVVGLGWGASPIFVEELAKAGRGSFSYVADRDVTQGLERTLVSHLLDACVPVVQEATVDWSSIGTPLLTAEPVFEVGQRLAALAIFPEAKKAPVALEAALGGVWSPGGRASARVWWSTRLDRWVMS
ncbi:unnamed protein product [Effrenium voratum]|nr:unnamed protein product [Effrenium voratum]